LVRKHKGCFARALQFQPLAYFDFLRTPIMLQSLDALSFGLIIPREVGVSFL
jgi:hypothetical protein